MEQYISRSEQKRRSKALEDLASELIELSPADIKRLPCDTYLQGEITQASAMSAGAKKRQIKYIAKQCRQTDCEPLFAFLEARKGSKLKQNKLFHEIERLRDDIITEALAVIEEAEGQRGPLELQWESETLALALQRFPGLDEDAVKTATIQFARSRKPVFSREIFRLLKTAMDHKQFPTTTPPSDLSSKKEPV